MAYEEQEGEVLLRVVVKEEDDDDDQREDHENHRTAQSSTKCMLFWPLFVFYCLIYIHTLISP